MVLAAPAVHEEVQQWANQQQQEQGQNAEEVRPMFGEQEEAGDRQKGEKYPAQAPACIAPSVRMGVVVIHIASPHVDVNFKRFSSAEFTITDSELKAMAAAAMIGFKKPKAATGIPMVL